MARRKVPSADVEGAHPDYPAFVSFMTGHNVDTEGIAEWDFKPTTIQDAVLATLAAGMAIQFGMNREGTAVSLAVWSDGARTGLGYSEDPVQLEEKLIDLTSMARKYKAAKAAAKAKKG